MAAEPTENPTPGDIETGEKPTCVNRALTFFKDEQPLWIGIAQNFTRDYIWGVWSQFEWNIFFKQTLNDYGLEGQWLGQQTYPTIGMAGLSAIIAACYALKKKNIPYKDMIATFMGAAAAIIPWNCGQNLGDHMGQVYLKMTPYNAQLFASLLTGGFEGPTQCIMIKLTHLVLNNQNERKKFMTDTKSYLKKFAAELGYSATIGAIPGTVWQLVFAACVAAEIPALVTGLFIAISVGLANLGVAKLQTQLFALSCCQPTDPKELEPLLSTTNPTPDDGSVVSVVVAR